MKTIYIDTLFLLNLIINYLLLLAAARLSGYPFSRLRIFFAAALGALYAVFCFFPSFGFLSGALCKILFGALMAAAAFSARPFRAFLKRCALFFFISLLFGGGVLALFTATGGRLFDLNRGAIYINVSFSALLFAAAACYMALSLFLNGAFRHTAKEGEIVRVELTLDGRTCDFSALLDTGNTLSDPLTNSPVLVAELAAVLPLFSEEVARVLNERLLKDAPKALEKLSCLGAGGRFRLLPYRALGTDSGMLLAFRPEKAAVGGKPRKLLVALSPGALSEGAGYSALAGVL